MKRFVRVSKPGIVMGNALHVVAGYLFAYSYGLDWVTGVGVVVGTSLVIASACAVNNWLDRYIDAKMKRTEKREVVTGKLSKMQIYNYALATFLAGSAVLYFTTNTLVLLIGFISYILYVWVYGYFKRRTPWGTLVGSVPGALPIVAGYAAHSGVVDSSAVGLFLILIAWQMVHFYAIAVFRKDEYKAAGVPVLTVVRSEKVVHDKLVGWGFLYIVILIYLALGGVFGQFGGVVMIGFGVWWYAALFYPVKPTLDKWARRVFYRSLVLPYAMVTSGIIMVVLG